MCNGRGTEASMNMCNEARMNIHQASYFVSIPLILPFILASSVPSIEIGFKALLVYTSQGLRIMCHMYDTNVI